MLTMEKWIEKRFSCVIIVLQYCDAMQTNWIIWIAISAIPFSMRREKGWNESWKSILLLKLLMALVLVVLLLLLLPPSPLFLFFIFPPFVIKKLLYFFVSSSSSLLLPLFLLLFLRLPEPLLLAFYYNKLSSVRVNGNSSYLYNVILKICINRLVDYSFCMVFDLFPFICFSPMLPLTSEVASFALASYADVPCMLAHLLSLQSLGFSRLLFFHFILACWTQFRMVVGLLKDTSTTINLILNLNSLSSPLLPYPLALTERAKEWKDK